MGHERIHGLQSLRAVLALIVAGGHSFLIFSLPDPIAGIDAWLRFHCFSILQAGNAVMVFYVLSGFVLSTYFRASGLKDFVGNAAFIVRRVARLWPVAAASVVIGIAYVAAIPSLHSDIASPWFNVQLFPVSLQQASLIRNFLIYDWDFNGVLWSIWVEISAAFSIPMLVLIKDRLGPLSRISLALLLASLMSYGQAPLMCRFMFCFYLGLFVHRAIALVSLKHVCVTVAILIAAQEYSLQGHMTAAKNEVIAAACGFVLVCYFAQPHVARSRFLEWLGDISYSFYVLHTIILHAVAVLYLKSILSLVGSHFVAQAVIAGLSILIAIFAAIPMHYMVERPSVRVASWLGAAIIRLRFRSRSLPNSN